MSARGAISYWDNWQHTHRHGGQLVLLWERWRREGSPERLLKSRGRSEWPVVLAVNQVVVVGWFGRCRLAFRLSSHLHFPSDFHVQVVCATTCVPSFLRSAALKAPKRVAPPSRVFSSRSTTTFTSNPSHHLSHTTTHLHTCRITYETPNLSSKCLVLLLFPSGASF